MSNQIVRPGTPAWTEALQSETPPDGLYAEVPEGIYHGKWRLASQSAMKVALQRTPAHARYALDHPEPPTSSLAVGTALHAAVLQPQRFDSIVGVGPTATRSSKAWQAEAEARPDCLLLTQDEYDRVLGMAEMVRSLPDVCRMQEASFGGETEVSFVATLTGTYPASLDPDQRPYSLQVKGRLDWWIGAIGWNVDLKTCADASPPEFNRAIHSYGYHIQAALYEAGLAALGQKVKRTVFVLVENQPPHAPAMRELMLEAMERGRVLARRMVDLWAWCVHNDQYPGYPPTIGEATLPPWAFTTTQDHYSLWAEEE